MIIDCSEFCYFEVSGLTVYFDEARWHGRISGLVELFRQGRAVGAVYVGERGAKARIKELKKAGFLESESGVRS